MAIGNYGNLKTAVADWAHRDVTQIVDFITLAEKRINALLNTRLAEAEVQLVSVVSSRFIALPSGFIYQYGLWETTYGSRLEMQYVQSEILPVIDTVNRPRFYSIDGANIAFDCPSDQVYNYDFRYKKGYSIASTLTNDVLTNYPGVYLFGALVEHSLFSRDINAGQIFEQRFQEAILECKRSESQNKANAELRFDHPVSSLSNNIFNGGV